MSLTNDRFPVLLLHDRNKSIIILTLRLTIRKLVVSQCRTEGKHFSFCPGYRRYKRLRYVARRPIAAVSFCLGRRRRTSIVFLVELDICVKRRRATTTAREKKRRFYPERIDTLFLIVFGSLPGWTGRRSTKPLWTSSYAERRWRAVVLRFSYDNGRRWTSDGTKGRNHARRIHIPCARTRTHVTPT